MKTWLILLCAGTFAAQAQAGAAPAPARAIAAKGSRIEFVFKQENVPVSGSFKKFSGIVALDPAQPKAIEISVDVSSISAGSEDADSEVVKPAWLSVKLFPQALFISKSLKPLGGDRWEASGPLTIKGVARDAVVPFTVMEQAGGGAELDGKFLIKRADYKVGEGEWSAFDVVANEIQVKFHLVLSPAAH